MRIPTDEDLSTRDLTEIVTRIAKKRGITVDEMFTFRARPAPEARAQLYHHLLGVGWSRAAVGRFVGKDHTCIEAATDKYPEDAK